MTLTYDGRPVKVAEVEATVKFLAYVFDDRDQMIAESDGDGPSLEESIAGSIADAIEHRACHLYNSDEFTGLIATAEELELGTHVIATYRTVTTEATSDDLDRAIRHTRAAM